MGELSRGNALMLYGFITWRMIELSGDDNSSLYENFNIFLYIYLFNLSEMYMFFTTI